MSYDICAPVVLNFMRGSRKFCQRGSKIDKIFILFYLVDEGIEVPNITINGPSSTRQRNAIKWRFAGGPMVVRHRMLGSFVVLQGIRTSIAKKPYIFVIFQGVRALWIRTCH